MKFKMTSSCADRGTGNIIRMIGVRLRKLKLLARDPVAPMPRFGAALAEHQFLC